MIQKVIRFIKRTEYSLGVTQQKSMCLLLKVIKAELEVQRICVSGDPWVRKIPWRRKWQPTLVFLSENSHGQEPGRLQSKGSQRVGHDWATKHIQALLKGQSWPCPPGLWSQGWDESNSSCNTAQTQCNTDMFDSASPLSRGKHCILLLFSR